MDFKKLSDFDLNLMAARLLVDYNHIEEKKRNDDQTGVIWGDGCNWYTFDPCNDWTKIGTVIEEHKINLNFANRRCAAMSPDYEHEYIHVNPKRAAVIVFLKIKGVV